MRVLTSALLMALLAGPTLAQTGAPAPAPGSTAAEPRRDAIEAPAAGGWNCDGLLPRTAAAGALQPTPVDEIEDEDVRDVRGKEVGEIENVVMGEGDQLYAVVEFGGFLGIGEEKRLVPLRAMIMRNDRIYMPCMTEAELKTLPAWRSGQATYRELEDAYLAPIESYR
jgi:hypothetical protein